MIVYVGVNGQSKYISAVWANTVAAGTLLSGLICPFLGAVLDLYGANLSPFSHTIRTQPHVSGMSLRASVSAAT